MTQPTIDQAYLAKRQLRKGTAGWILLAGLGVSYVISGDFAGWNFGIAEAGWGGFAIAACLMALMYLALVLSLAEMSAAIPAAGGGYSFARQAMGPAGTHYQWLSMAQQAFPWAPGKMCGGPSACTLPGGIALPGRHLSAQAPRPSGSMTLMALLHSHLTDWN